MTLLPALVSEQVCIHRLRTLIQFSLHLSIVKIDLGAVNKMLQLKTPS